MSDYLSETSTNQRQTPLCAVHSMAKLIVQNVFHYLLPTQVDVETYVRNQCNRYVDYDVFSLQEMPTFSPDECSPGGYDKILQFLCVFYLLVEHFGYVDGIAANEMTPVLHNTLFEGQIPKFFDHPNLQTHRSRLVEMVDAMNRERKRRGLRYVFHAIKILQENNNEFPQAYFQACMEVIKTSLSKGLYVFATLRNSNYVPKDKSTDQSHAIHIVSTYRDELVVKNSWGDARVYLMELDGTLRLPKTDYEFVIEKLNFATPLTDSLTSVLLLRESSQEVFDLLETVRGRIAAVPTTSRGKQLTQAPIFRRGDPVLMSDGKAGIFSHYQKDGECIVYTTDLVSTRALPLTLTPAEVSRDSVNILKFMYKNILKNLQQGKSKILALEGQGQRQQRESKILALEANEINHALQNAKRSIFEQQSEQLETE